MIIFVYKFVVSTLTKKNYSELQFTLVQNYGIMGFWFTMEKLRYYGERNDGAMKKNYGTIPSAMELRLT